MNKAAGDASPPRLPMTLNLVLKASREGIHGHLFRHRHLRWLAAPTEGILAAKDGPLDLIDHQNIDRIETNLQIAHALSKCSSRFPH